MSMSSAGRAASSSGCVGRPRALEIGLSGFAVQIRPSSLTGSYAMATAEHREPYESRGSRTVLGAPGGESPPGDSTKAEELSLSVCFPAYPRKRTLGISARHPDADRVVHALATCVLRRAAEIPCKFNRVVRHQTVVCPS